MRKSIGERERKRERGEREREREREREKERERDKKREREKETERETERERETKRERERERERDGDEEMLSVRTASSVNDGLRGIGGICSNEYDEISNSVCSFSASCCIRRSAECLGVRESKANT